MSVSYRPTWDAYFLDVAVSVAMRADCTRRRVGCVIVGERHRILSTGYNGAEPGGPSCLAGQCPRGAATDPEALPDKSSCVAIHAEVNALLFAGREVRGATAYITNPPCGNCLKLLRGAGVVRVVFGDRAAEDLRCRVVSRQDYAL